MESYQQIRDRKLREKINRHLVSEELSKNEQEMIKAYHAYSLKQGLDLYTIETRMREFKVFLRDFKVNPKKATHKDIDNYLSLLGSRDYKEATVDTKKVFLIIFFEWLHGKKKADIDLIKDIKAKRNNGHYKLPEELLTPEEIKKMVVVADNFRDKCMVIMLYETASRRGEFLQLKIKHCDITNEKYAMVTIPMGKTTSRKIPLLFSMPHLREHLNSHPLRDNPDAPLFITQGSHLGQPLGDSGLKLILQKTSKRAEIKKKVHPHLLRHSRLTELAKELTEQELKVFAGWVGDSKMVKTYVHLSGSDVSNKLLANAGLIDSKDVRIKQKVLEQVICPRCTKVNSADEKYCKCGYCLDIKLANKEIEEQKSLRQEFEENKEQTSKLMEMVYAGLPKDLQQAYKKGVEAK